MTTKSPITSNPTLVLRSLRKYCSELLGELEDASGFAARGSGAASRAARECCDSLFTSNLGSFNPADWSAPSGIAEAASGSRAGRDLARRLALYRSNRHPHVNNETTQVSQSFTDAPMNHWSWGTSSGLSLNLPRLQLSASPGNRIIRRTAATTRHTAAMISAILLASASRSLIATKSSPQPGQELAVCETCRLQVGQVIISRFRAVLLPPSPRCGRRATTDAEMWLPQGRNQRLPFVQPSALAF